MTTDQFALTYRISNTADWRVWGVYPTKEDAIAARKAMPGLVPTNNPNVHGKVLGTNIRAAYEWEV